MTNRNERDIKAFILKQVNIRSLVYKEEKGNEHAGGLVRALVRM